MKESATHPTIERMHEVVASGEDARIVDLITLGANGLIETSEVVLRPLKTIGALCDEMMARIGRDPRFLAYRKALGLIGARKCAWLAR